MEDKSIVEKMEMNYRQEGDYLIPDLELPEQKEIGRYGRMRRKYLEEHQRSEYSQLILTLKLNQHLAETDEKAQEMVESIMAAMLEKDPAPDKATDMLGWVGHMNRIKSQAEEIMYQERIYPEEYSAEK